jgi:hypothetical protein
MTLIIGIACSDGVVIASDSAATMCSGRVSTIEQATKKIHLAGGDNILFGGTGAVGFDQRFLEVVTQVSGLGEFRGMKTAMDKAKRLSKVAIEDFNGTFAVPGGHVWKGGGGLYAALTAYVVNDQSGGKKAALCEFDLDTFQPQLVGAPGLWFSTLGSGSTVADPVLALLKTIFWNETTPSLQSGIFAATWTMQHAIAVNTGGVNGPFHVGVIDPKLNPPGYLLPEDKLMEHKAAVDDAHRHFRQYEAILLGTKDASAPPTPTLG